VSLYVQDDDVVEHDLTSITGGMGLSIHEGVAGCKPKGTQRQSGHHGDIGTVIEGLGKRVEIRHRTNIEYLPVRSQYVERQLDTSYSCRQDQPFRLDVTEGVSMAIGDVEAYSYLLIFPYFNGSLTGHTSYRRAIRDCGHQGSLIFVTVVVSEPEPSITWGLHIYYLLNSNSAANPAISPGSRVRFCVSPGLVLTYIVAFLSIQSPIPKA
jgi:hypothetical protein